MDETIANNVALKTPMCCKARDPSDVEVKSLLQPINDTDTTNFPQVLMGQTLWEHDTNALEVLETLFL